MQPRAARIDAAIAAALFGASLLWFSLGWNRTFELRDEGLLFRFGARIAAGEVPYRDFEDAYGPASHLLTALGIRLFDGEILGVRRLLAVAKAAAVALSYGVARFVAPRPFALFGGMLAMFWWGRAAFNLNAPYAAVETIPVCLASLWLLLLALARGSRAAYAAAGLAAGAAILFKQSLGLFHVYGMALALCSVSAIETAAPSPGSPRRTAAGIALYTAAGLALVVASREYLGVRDYLIHFLALHLAMGWVALCVLARGGLGPLRPWLTRRLIPFALGASALPVATALLYLGWGAADELWDGMFVLATAVANYALPAALPPPPLALALAAAILLCASGLQALAGRRRAAWALVAVSVAAVAAAAVTPVGAIDATDVVGLRDSPLLSLSILWQAGAFFTGVQSALIALAALVCVGPALLRPRGADGDAHGLRFALPILFFHLMVSLQSFPRASYNTWVAQGAFAPLLAFVLHRAYRSAGPPAAPLRRLAAATLVALVPLWWIFPVALRTAVPSPLELPRAPVGAPKTAGIAVGGPLFGEWLDGFRALVPYLEEARPPEAPLFVLSNEGMLHYVSGRAPLFPEHELHLFLLGWDLLPPSYVARLPEAALVDRLRSTPDAILVDHPGDPAAQRLRRALPALSAFVDAEYETLREIPPYRVLRRRVSLR